MNIYIYICIYICRHRSTLGLCNLHHRRIGDQNWGSSTFWILPGVWVIVASKGMILVHITSWRYSRISKGLMINVCWFIYLLGCIAGYGIWPQFRGSFAPQGQAQVDREIFWFEATKAVSTIFEMIMSSCEVVGNTQNRAQHHIWQPAFR